MTLPPNHFTLDPTNPPVPPVDTTQITTDPALFCPACGYDLRATTTPRCPECGKPFDPATLAASRIPWVHRKTLGRTRAYLRTLRLVTFHPFKLAEEITRPVDWQSASRFRWITITLALIPSTAALFAIYPYAANDFFGGIPEFIVRLREDATGNITPRALLWPALALLDTRWIIPIVILGLALGLALLSWWIRVIFWIASPEPAQKQRASALSCYVGVPAFTLAFLAVLDLAWKAWNEHEMPQPRWLIVTIALAHITLLGWWTLRILILTSKTTHRGVRFLFASFVAYVTGLVITISLSLGLVDYLFGMAAFLYFSLC